MRWVATTPPGIPRHPPPRRPEPYTGPPSYPAPPRWGFPKLTWRWPTAVPGTPSDTPHPMQRLRTLGHNAGAALWTVAAFAAVTAAAEVWRYVLLAQSRGSALSPGVVGASDALVLAGALLTFVLAILAFGGSLWWLLVARAVAADAAGQAPARSGPQVVAGVLVPGVNLVLAGSILAELEHTVLRKPSAQRPRPSRLVLWWWGLFAGNGVLLAVTILWRMRDGVQAEADGVLLTASTDLTAAALAVVTALVVRRLTLLLAPLDASTLRPLRVLKVTGAPRPERPARPATAPR
ncbi:DUF4328 domain-containing protein [Amycolatopsis antarctica]|uniref:DUF4328 domain-containing protein n=1 Tax=Amycolatopsis antarctica TaxID=1854586 RepID=UPI001F0A1039|nr:DUF4328 domain-containing protein [Amycolatopsis antarctica]